MVASHVISGPMTKRCLCDDREKRNYYRYYDTPDGCDIDKKVVVTTRYGVIVGIIFGSYDVLMYSHAVGFSNILARYARHCLPLGLMGATFTLVSNGLLINRKVDDALNYFLGGLACGPLVAYYVRNKHGLVAGGVALGIAATLKKGAIDNGYCFFPKINRHMGTCNSWRRDFTLSEDPKDHYKHTCVKGSECGK